MGVGASVEKQVDFSLHLTHQVGSKLSSSSNLAFSPVSLHVILCLVAAGSKGDTLKQLTSFLRSDASPDLASKILADASRSGGPSLSFANGVWIDQSLSLKTSFKKNASATFKAEVGSLDFQRKADEAAKIINSWAEKRTNGLIKELLPPGSVNSATSLVLGNALYFKGAWTQKFDAAETEEGDFYLPDGNSVKVPFMSSWKEQFVHAYLDFKVLRLTYKRGGDNRQFSMYIFLPDSKDGLWSLAEKLGSGSEFLSRHLPMQKAPVRRFRVPKFKISSGFEVSSILKNLGVTLPFSAEADLTGIGPMLYVSEIFHKSFIEVNEEGTEAAAATAALMMGSALPMDRIDFVADHPFIFLIREDKSGVVMFTGHVLDPSVTA